MREDNFVLYGPSNRAGFLCTRGGRGVSTGRRNIKGQQLEEESQRQAQLGVEVLHFLADKPGWSYPDLSGRFDRPPPGDIGLVLHDLLVQDHITKTTHGNVAITDAGRVHLRDSKRAR